MELKQFPKFDPVSFTLVPPRRFEDLRVGGAEHLGEVEAPDKRSAIKKAAGLFDIPLERQNRITVTKITGAQRC